MISTKISCAGSNFSIELRKCHHFWVEKKNIYLMLCFNLFHSDGFSEMLIEYVWYCPFCVLMGQIMLHFGVEDLIMSFQIV